MRVCVVVGRGVKGGRLGCKVLLRRFEGDSRSPWLHPSARASPSITSMACQPTNNVPQASFSWAWVLDERPEERSRGVTVDVAMARFVTPKYNVTLLDAPGHRWGGRARLAWFRSSGGGIF